MLVGPSYVKQKSRQFFMARANVFNRMMQTTKAQHVIKASCNYQHFQIVLVQLIRNCIRSHVITNINRFLIYDILNVHNNVHLY